jgi:hypothetical protein
MTVSVLKLSKKWRRKLTKTYFALIELILRPHILISDITSTKVLRVVFIKKIKDKIIIKTSYNLYILDYDKKYASVLN